MSSNNELPVLTFGPEHLTGRQIACLQQTLWRSDEDAGAGLPTISWYVADEDPAFCWEQDDYAAYEQQIHRELTWLTDVGLLTDTFGDGEFRITAAGDELLGRIGSSR